MIKDLKQLKSFLKWCKKEKIQHVSVEGMEFTFSGLALIDLENRTTDNVETLDDLYDDYRDLSVKPSGVTASKPEDDPDLFYSVD